MNVELDRKYSVKLDFIVTENIILPLDACFYYKLKNLILFSVEAYIDTLILLYAIDNSLISRKWSSVNTSTEKWTKTWQFLFRILWPQSGEIKRKPPHFLQYANTFRQYWIRYLPKVSCERLNHLSWYIIIWCFEYVENEISENLSLPKVIKVLLYWDKSTFRW